MALSDAKIRNAKPKAHRYRLADTHGLSLEISPSGNRLWRYRYRIAGKENLFAAGEWCQAPIGETAEQVADRQQGGRMTLAEARLARVTWRAQVKGGQHPRLVRAALAPGPIPQRPRAFIANIVAALQPFMDEWTRREGVTDAEVYEALRPFFAGYTVGDAALMLAQLGAALFATPGETAAKGDSPAFGALCEAKHMLEDFAVEARASGPDCVGARAFLLKNAGTDEGLVCESNLASIHASIRWDTSALRRGNFDGETFDSPSRNGSLNWLVKARERREQRNAGQNSQ